MKKFAQRPNAARQGGFTLIELLIVISIIAILAVTVFVALDPVKRFADARNSRRWADVDNILTAVHQSIVDNKGALPTGLTTGMVETQLGTDATGCNTCGSATACVDLSTPLSKYLKNMPLDAGTGTAGKTGYSIIVDANNIVTISACNAESGSVINVSR